MAKKNSYKYSDPVWTRIANRIYRDSIAGKIIITIVFVSWAVFQLACGFEYVNNYQWIGWGLWWLCGSMIWRSTPKTLDRGIMYGKKEPE